MPQHQEQTDNLGSECCTHRCSWSFLAACKCSAYQGTCYSTFGIGDSLQDARSEE